MKNGIKTNSLFYERNLFLIGSLFTEIASSTPLIGAAVVHAVSEALQHKVVRMHRLILICQMEAFKSHFYLSLPYWFESFFNSSLTFTKDKK